MLPAITPVTLDSFTRGDTLLDTSASELTSDVKTGGLQ